MPLRSIVAALFLCLLGSNSYAQQCDGNVPNLVVDLSSAPNATYLSPSIVRNGYCCGVTGNDRCIRFEITLHPEAQGITFAICEGAVPPGAMFYQVNCGPLTAVGTPLCLSGPGPHILTFCKPGNNNNRYCIASIPAPSAGPPITLNEGCTGTLTTSGFAPGSVQWTSISPGAAGAYNNYLSCPTCPTTNVTAQPGYPAYVDYQVCGYAVSPCSQMTFCDTVRVTFHSTLTATIVPEIPTVCFGATGTTLTVIGAGGSPPYSYAWNNGQTTESIYVGPGTYTVALSDNSNCPPTMASVVVTQFMQPIAALAGTDIVVCGASPVAQLNGSVTGVTTGQWITGGGQFSPSNTALNATYTPTAAEVANGFVDLVLITTNNGECPGDQDTVRVYFDPGITNGTVTGTDATCNGVANGSATFSPADPTYTYLWNDPQAQTTATATGLAAGTYTVTASTALGCSVTLPVTIGQPAALLVASMNVENETCAGMGNGMVTANVSGGTAPYTYSWNVPGTGPTVMGPAGEYVVTVSDANGCAPVVATATIQSNGQPNVADAGADQIGCGGGAIPLQGTVQNATGGLWSGGNGVFSGTGLNVQYQPTAAEILAGSVELTLTTTGNTSCPPASDQVMVYLSNAFLSAALTATDATCNNVSNGALTFGPVAPGMTFQWQGFPGQTGPTVTGVPAGQHSVLVTDALGCTATFTATVSQPDALAIAEMALVNESCAGTGNGSVSVTMSGGTAPYSYSWNVPGNGPVITGTTGTYTVTVTDANGCAPVVGTATIQSNGQPNVADAGADQIGCEGGPIPLQGTVQNATGGLWSGGNGVFTGTGLNVQYQPTAAEILAGSVQLTLTTTGNTSCPPASDQVMVYLSNAFLSAAVTATNATCNNVSNGALAFSPVAPGMTFQWQGFPNQTGPTVTGVAAGQHSVLVTDALGCTATFTATVSQPAALLIAEMAVVNESCAGTGNGSVSVTMNGGTAPYSYSWNVPGNGPVITGTTGNYTVTVTDANGCMPVQGTASIAANGQPNIANAGADIIACGGAYPIQLQGSVINATGGVWSGGSGSFIGSGTNAQYQPTAAEIVAGSVTLTLSTIGNTSCPQATDQVLISLSNAFLNAQLNATNVICAGGANGIVSYSPALPGLTYQWQGMPQQTGPSVSGLPVGTYTVLVTDPLGCSATFSATLTQPSPMAITGTSSTPVSCPGYSDGIANVMVAGGVPPYTYAWSASAFGQTVVPAVGLPVGTHSVTIMDSYGCTLNTEVIVGQPPPLTLVANVPEVVCVNTPVQMSANATGGSGSYQYHWPGIGNGSSIWHTFTGPQTVMVSVTDANNCTGPVLEIPVTVLDLQAASMTTYGDTVVCPGGEATVGVSLMDYGGEYTIWWPQLGVSGEGPFTIPVTSNTTLTMVITDQCSQTLNGSISLGLQTPPNISLPPVIAQGCSPLSVQMPSNLTGQQVSYLWNLGNGTTSTQPAPQVNYNNAGTYTVSLTVSTPLGCTATAQNTGIVTVNASPSVSMNADPWITNIDNATIDFTSQSNGNIVGSFWSFGDGSFSNAVNPSHTYSDVGSFMVTLEVQDANGCTKTTMGQVEITPVYDIVVPNIFTPALSGPGSGVYDPWDLSNDVFYPFIRYVKDYRMRVFNRWGELIFESNELNRGWNGYYRDQLSPQDVYVYQLWVRFVDGKEKHQLGDITLLR